MTFPNYSTGTVSVAANGTVVTGVGSIWSGVNARQGDLLQIADFQTIVSAVTDVTHLVIPPWGGGAQSAVAYTIWQTSPLRFVGGQAMADVSELVAALNTTGFYFFVDPSLSAPDPSLGNDGQYAFQAVTGKLWLKSGGVWVFVGVYKGVNPLGDWSGAAAYNGNDIVTLSGSSYICILAHTNHTPPNATYWQLLASIGATGIQGAGYACISATSFTIGTGSKAFTTQAGLAWLPGARARVASVANVANYMEGIVTAYSGTTLTVNVSKIVGSGTDADWRINLAGDPGSGDMLSTNNLADVADAVAALNNLGLGAVTYVVCGGIDDTAAMQAALDAGPTVFIGNCVTGPLDLTNRVVSLRGVGATLSNINPLPGHVAWATSHGHILDLTGSYLCELRDFSIGWIDGSTESSVVVATAIFNAQTDPATSNINTFRNLFVKGHYRSTAFYVYGVASGTVDNCQFSNFLPGADTNATAGYFTGNNGWSLTSQFATVSALDGIGAPQWDIDGSEWHVFPGAGGNSSALWFDDANAIHFFGGNISAGGKAYAQTSGNVAGILFHGTAFGNESQPVSAASLFYVNTGSSLTNVSLLANDYSGLTTMYAGPGSFPVADNSLGAAAANSLAVGFPFSIGTSKFITVGDNSAVSALAVGQGSSNYLSFAWGYDVIPSSAGAQIATAGYSNPLTIDASAITIQGASGGALTLNNGGAAPTGTGAYVRKTSPTLVTPNLGTPSAIVLTSATGLPISTGVTGLGSGVAAFLATPSSANLKAALTDETGSGAAVFGTSPAITTPTGIVKGDVGLGNVDNTSDASKPVSTLQAAALALKAPLAPYFSAYLSASQTVTLSTSTKILFNTEVADSNNFYDNATNFRFQPTIAGKYLVHVHVQGIATTQVNYTIANIYKNGANYAQAQLAGPAATSQNADVAMIVAFNGSTDYVEGWAQVIGTGTATIAGGTAPIQSFMEAYYIGA